MLLTKGLIRVGIGIPNPAQALHVNGSVQLDKTGSALGRLVLNTVSRNDPGRYGIQFANNAGAPFLGDDTQPISFNFMSGWSNQRTNDASLKVFGKAANSWGTSLALTHDGTNGLVSTDVGHVVLNPAGNVGIGTTSPAYPLQLASGAHVTAGGVWTNASSRTLKQGIASLPLDQAVAAVEQLAPVTYTYKASPDERHVGFIAEDVPDLVATADRQSLAAMDIVAVLTKVVQAQQETLRAQQETLRVQATSNNTLKALVADLQARMAELERQLAIAKQH